MNQTNTHGLRKPRRPKYQLSPDTMLSGQWRTTCLYAAELEAIDTGLDLHRYQLEQLSQRELVRALESAEGDVRSNRGVVVNRRELEVGVAA